MVWQVLAVWVITSAFVIRKRNFWVSVKLLKILFTLEALWNKSVLKSIYKLHLVSTWISDSITCESHIGHRCCSSGRFSYRPVSSPVTYQGSSERWGWGVQQGYLSWRELGSSIVISIYRDFVSLKYESSRSSSTFQALIIIRILWALLWLFGLKFYSDNLLSILIRENCKWSQL